MIFPAARSCNVLSSARSSAELAVQFYLLVMVIRKHFNTLP